MPSIPASAATAARDVVVTVSRLRRRLREVAGDDLGLLTPSQTSVLSRISKGEASSASELAAVERVTPQSIASTIDALEAAGLVVRTPDPDDGRRRRLALTAMGRRRVEGSRRARNEWLARALHERYSESERRRIIEVMALLERLSTP